MKVLVVDDNRALRDALRRALRLDGHEVAVADPPNAVVLDVGMPDIDRLEVSRRLRTAGNRVPVLMSEVVRN